MGEQSPEDYVPEHRAEEPTSHGLMSDTLYDRLKFLAMVVLPALTVLYLSLAPLWGLPKQEEVAGSIAALDVFLGALLGLSSRKHNADPSRYAGKVIYTRELDENGNPNVLMVPEEDPGKWEGKKEVTFKIQSR